MAESGLTTRRRIGARHLSGSEFARLIGFFGVVVLLHVVGWGFFLYYRNDFGAAYAAAGALAYGFGLRHAFDADHISAIDDTTRLLIQKGKKPLGVGFFFSLGHSSVVFSLAVAVAFAAQAIQRQIGTFQSIGSVIGATVSGTFLWIVGILNLLVLIGLVRLWNETKRGRFKKDELDELLLQRGFMNRLLGGRFRRFISESWQMYPVGVLFGLGFDTASEVGLLAITAAATTTTAGGGHVPLMGIIALPMLFAAGMSLMDTADGAFMAKAYGWAFSNPLRKVYYNMTTTALSVFVALVVGTIEYVQVVSEKLNANGGFFAFLGNLDFAKLGYGIVAAFLLTWVGSVALFKLRRVEERWGGLVEETAEDG